jgi:hypothetical protein
VSKEAIKMLEFTNRKNKNATPEYAVWVKSRDELMNDPVLVVGQKPDMEKAFSLLTPLSSSCPCPMILTLYSPFISLMSPLQEKSENKSDQEETTVYDNRIDAKTDDSAKENVPKEEDALSNPNSKQEKNESNQEKTIDIEPQQQPSTSKYNSSLINLYYCTTIKTF